MYWLGNVLVTEIKNITPQYMIASAKAEHITFLSITKVTLKLLQKGFSVYRSSIPETVHSHVNQGESRIGLWEVLNTCAKRDGYDQIHYKWLLLTQYFDFLHFH